MNLKPFTASDFEECVGHHIEAASEIAANIANKKIQILIIALEMSVYLDDKFYRRENLRKALRQITKD
jgi:citrate lyase beta subunit